MAQLTWPKKLQTVRKMKTVNLGGGVIAFENAIDIPQDLIIPIIDKLAEEWQKRNFTIVNDENGYPSHAINEGGFIYTLELMNASPIRVQMLEHSFFKECEKAIYKCLLNYIEIFPALLQCVWWKSAGHILKYNTGAALGLHCDNDVNYRYGSFPATEHATRNVVSCLIYFNDCTDDMDDKNTKYGFSGGQMTIPYFNISIAPKKGTIVFMPANYLGAHEIHRVTSGSRYSYLSWFAQGSEYPEKGINPRHEESEDGIIDGQFWVKTIIDDYQNYIKTKYADAPEISGKLFQIESRAYDHENK